MSHSPERMSSYRRCFEGTSVNQLRVASPSPTRRETRHRSASFNRNVGWKVTGCRALTNKPRLTRQEANLDLDAAAAENQAFKLTRSNERQEMVVLNDRLASYIEKVRTLESKNKMLEADIEALKSAYERTTGLRQLYASQLKELNREAEQIREQRDVSLIAKEAMASQLDVLKSKYDEALEARKQNEHLIEALRPDVDKATSARIKLEKQLENLEAELTFLQRVHKEEIDELMQQIYSAASKMDLNFDLPDLSSALTQIQSQYDSIAAKNLLEMDAWYRSMFQDMNDTSSKHAQRVRSLREKIAAYRKNILSKERDLESLRARNESLEAHICDTKEKQMKLEEELEEHKEAIKQDLKLTKQKTALLMREYQELLNAKMAMEIEIATYRKLIDGEDSRLSTMVGKLFLTGYPHLTNSNPPDPLASLTPPTGSLKIKGPKDTRTINAETASAAVSTGNPTDANVQQQATEESERKTLLIRTIKTDEDTYVSDTQKCTITISGAAEDTDEE
ncbi:notochord granular surface isoform X2 [Girardinichthys multiradiatus]|uniref:notochord granular surface isoform X2 n=1 Tax=Girardinichthys multiradiatus TaxID=208333 RepID=UPI001FAC1819|nr:notochord granular surface isoform X2 [Girardinichthys multiradiatus]